jgi:hypothetical protein
MAPALRFLKIFKNYFLFFKIIILLIFLNYFNILISKNNFIKKINILSNKEFFEKQNL